MRLMFVCELKYVTHQSSFIEPFIRAHQPVRGGRGSSRMVRGPGGAAGSLRPTLNRTSLSSLSGCSRRTRGSVVNTAPSGRRAGWARRRRLGGALEGRAPGGVRVSAHPPPPAAASPRARPSRPRGAGPAGPRPTWTRSRRLVREIGPKGDRTAAAPGRRPTVTQSVAGSV